MTQTTDPTPFPLFPADSPERTARQLQAQLDAAQAAYDASLFLLCAGLLHAAADMADHLHTHRPNPLYQPTKPLHNLAPAREPTTGLSAMALENHLGTWNTP